MFKGKICVGQVYRMHTANVSSFTEYCGPLWPSGLLLDYYGGQDKLVSNPKRGTSVKIYQQRCVTNVSFIVRRVHAKLLYAVLHLDDICSC